MTQQTLDLIHRTYQKALEISTNHLEVSEKLYQLLYSENVVEEDCKLFDTFLMLFVHVFIIGKKHLK